MTTGSHKVDNAYIFTDDGPIYNALTKQRWFKTQTRLALLGLCIAWLPLVILSAIDGTLLTGVEMPFIHDIAM